MVAKHVGDQHHEQAGKEGNGARKAVDTVRQVHRVYDADEHDSHHDIVEEAEIDIADEGHEDLCIILAQIHDEEVDRRRQELQNQLLDRGQTEIALLDDLDIVVDEADTMKPIPPFISANSKPANTKRLTESSP